VAFAAVGLLADPGRAGSPVDGLRNSGAAAGLPKSNIGMMLPDITSNDPSPISPRCQFCSMNRRIADCAVSAWPTKFTLAYGEITSSGTRGP